MSALENVEAEALLLGALLVPNDTTILDAVADKLSPADFYEPAHGNIFEVILQQHALGKSASPVTLKGYFDGDTALERLGGPSYLMRLTANDAGVMLPAELCDMIADLSHRRNLQAALVTASSACEDMQSDVAEIIAYADSAFDTGKQAVIEMTGGQCLDALVSGLGKEVRGTLSGISAFDDRVGPLCPGQFVVLAGRPGMAKTATALSYAIGAASNGHGVLFCSLEMSSTELAQRMAADMCFEGSSNVPYSAIRDGQLNDWQRSRVEAAARRAWDMPLTIIDTGNLKLGRLNSLIRRHKRRMAAKGYKLELVVVDYLQLLRTDLTYRSNYEAVSEISRSMKAMSKENDIAVLGLAQLSREVEKRGDKRPQLADLRDSGQIEQDADTVVFLLRPEYYLRQEEPDIVDPKRVEWEALMSRVQGQIEFIVAKRRNGVTGTATGRFYGACQAVRG